MIYVYAIGEAETAPAGAPVEVIRGGHLSAFVCHDAVRPEPTPEALREHDRVVSVLAEDGPVLPMRFGTTLPGADDLRDVLRVRGEEFDESLDRVRGRVEFGVRTVRPAWAGGPAPRTGTHFMRAKLDRRKAARGLAELLHEPLAAIADDSTLALCPDDETAFAAAYLVPRARSAEFTSTARALRVVASGPWPPYSFTEPRHG